MERITFTQPAMYQLASINTHLRRTVDSHYKISGEDDMEKLLREAFASDDPAVKDRCSKLFDSLWVEEQNKLRVLLEA